LSLLGIGARLERYPAGPSECCGSFPDNPQLSEAGYRKLISARQTSHGFWICGFVEFSGAWPQVLARDRSSTLANNAMILREALDPASSLVKSPKAAVARRRPKFRKNICALSMNVIRFMIFKSPARPQSSLMKGLRDF
jgi:hypothetical protein